MQVQFYGTRGTIPVAGDRFAKYGGNTTSLRIYSPCLPQKMCLAVDAGTGFIPLTEDGIKEGVEKVVILFTHYHPDHWEAFPISDWTHMKNIPMYLFGPLEHKQGPAEAIQHWMRRPYFPVSHEEVMSHLHCEAIEHPRGNLFAIHPEGGVKLLPVNELELAERNHPAQLTFDGGGRHNVQDCLIIRMFPANHPDDTISYRFEERPTGKVFVFLTDHENQATMSRLLRKHLENVDLLVMDSQYSEETYKAKTGGFGHGTPRYCVETAKEAGIKCLGLTHHDPKADDNKVNTLLQNAREYAREIGYEGGVFACADKQGIGF